VPRTAGGLWANRKIVGVRDRRLPVRPAWRQNRRCPCRASGMMNIVQRDPVPLAGPLRPGGFELATLGLLAGSAARSLFGSRPYHPVAVTSDAGVGYPKSSVAPSLTRRDVGGRHQPVAQRAVAGGHKPGRMGYWFYARRCLGGSYHRPTRVRERGCDRAVATRLAVTEQVGDRARGRAEGETIGPTGWPALAEQQWQSLCSRCARAGVRVRGWSSGATPGLHGDSRRWRDPSC
jgi:hypothetical protein